MGSSDLFSVPIFFIVFRETLEASIIVSVLLSFIQSSTKSIPQSEEPLDSDGRTESDSILYKRLVKQVWIGSALGLGICLIIGGAFIGAFYALSKDIWGKSEELWEGIFSIIACVLITIMGIAMLRINKLKSKWTRKLAAQYEATQRGETYEKKALGQRFKDFSRKYSMFLLPFITVLREGLEAVVFVGGVGLSTPAKAVPIPVVCGLAAGSLVGYFIYRGNTYLSIEYALIISTWILYLVSAGLFSKAIGYFEVYKFNKATGGDAAESGAGPGSYNTKITIWHVNFGNPELNNNNNGGWEVFNAILGWTNTGTYGTVIGYIMYWVAVSVALIYMRYRELHPHSKFSWDAQKIKAKLFKKSSTDSSTTTTDEKPEDAAPGYSFGKQKQMPSQTVYEVGRSSSENAHSPTLSPAIEIEEQFASSAHK